MQNSCSHPVIRVATHLETRLSKALCADILARTDRSRREGYTHSRYGISHLALRGRKLLTEDITAEVLSTAREDVLVQLVLNTLRSDGEHVSYRYFKHPKKPCAAARHIFTVRT